MAYNLMITGHRPNRLGGFGETHTKKEIKERLKIILTKAYKRHSDLCLITGMAQGVDQWFADVAVKLSIPFKAYVPYKGQECRWRNGQVHYNKLLSAASEVKIITDNLLSGKMAARAALMRRNSSMIYDSEAAIAVWDGGLGGGTFNAVIKILQRNIPLTVIDPNNIGKLDSDVVWMNIKEKDYLFDSSVSMDR